MIMASRKCGEFCEARSCSVAPPPLCSYPTTSAQLFATFNSANNDGFPLPGRKVRKRMAA